MPTGYTAPVQDGTITELPDFVLNCARAFGAFVMLRDSDQSLETTRRYIESGGYLETSEYHESSLEKGLVDLAKLEAMSDEEALALVRADARAAARRNREADEKRRMQQLRYEKMIEKVDSWMPPTAEHVEFKEFMLTQLRESIDFDCSPFGLDAPDVSLGAHQKKIERLRKSIDFDREAIEKRRERNEGRKFWIEALIESLEHVWPGKIVFLRPNEKAPEPSRTWMTENEIRRFSPVSGEGYDRDDPKHPDWHSVHADLYDNREKGQ